MGEQCVVVAVLLSMLENGTQGWVADLQLSKAPSAVFHHLVLINTNPLAIQPRPFGWEWA